MFDFPFRSKLSEWRDEEFSNWLDPVRRTDTAVLGATPAGLLAGVVLLDAGRDVVVLGESEEIGERMLWETGPVPILTPTDELLDELGFDLDANPPVWVDRIELLDFLLHRFIKAGGRLIPGVYFESATQTEEGLELSIRLADHRETLETDHFVVAAPRVDLEESEERGETPLETMVLATGRTPEGWIRAGYQALPADVRDCDYPFVNSECLSGRKAAELVLNGE